MTVAVIEAQLIAASTQIPAIEIRHLQKVFGKFSAINDLSLTVNQGEIFGLLGPNGSGKTTTINMISGLTDPTAGTIHVFGRDIAKDPRSVRAILGAVPQETALYEELSAWRNMTFHAELYGVPRRERDQRITRLLELVQLLDRKDSRVGTFSGGMKRRIALARALLHDPQLIYLDEPTLGVDVQSRRALWNYILDLKQQGKTVLITTNYLEEASILCDRLAIIDHGSLIALDTPSDLKQKFGGSVIDLTTKQTLSASLIGRLRAIPGITSVTQDGPIINITVAGERSVTSQVLNLVAAESELDAITQREPNLDEIFLKLTGSALRD